MGKAAKLQSQCAGKGGAIHFDDLHPCYSNHEARVEADRCYFCYDAPCMNACPTSIDIPLFIRQISTDNPKGAAKTIFEQNIMGGICARVCPTETLCEEACVRNDAEEKPVKIGHLQRFATDFFMDNVAAHPYERAASTGKKIAIVGAGPAGLACAHALSKEGHDVTVFEAREKSGGLNEYGIAAYKAVDDFAQKEVNFILDLGGISIENGKTLGRDMTLEDLSNSYDAVFLGMGLGGVQSLGLVGEEHPRVIDAARYIEDLRQASAKEELPQAKSVLVIGGGMTAVDVAIQSKLLGAEQVTIAYRRGQEQMNASSYEQELAQTHGVQISTWLQPKTILSDGDQLEGMVFNKTKLDGGKLVATDDEVTLSADLIFKAIGQNFITEPVTIDMALELESDRIKVDGNCKTNAKNIWAGGDCVAGGEDLTVASVEDGKIAAKNIHEFLSA
jgi:glutamate synthase (NADPH/NADH) small chain